MSDVTAMEVLDLIAEAVAACDESRQARAIFVGPEALVFLATALATAARYADDGALLLGTAWGTYPVRVRPRLYRSVIVEDTDGGTWIAP